jgi:TonB family protein
LPTERIPLPVLPPNCNEYLPAMTAPVETQSVTAFSFRLTTDGEIKDVALYKSSGNDELDKVVLACASGRHIKPLTISGKRAEITWTMAYFWRGPRSGFGSLSPTGVPNLCSFSLYPRSAIRQHIRGDTLIFFQIAIDGSVKKPTVAASSGNADLDKSALDCVSKWQYFPIKQNGQPVQVDNFTKVFWRL